MTDYLSQASIIVVFYGIVKLIETMGKSQKTGYDLENSQQECKL